jgi:histidyl-tRNA synthetase
MTRATISGGELFKKARAVGQYYGFTPFSTLAARARRGSRDTEAKPALEFAPGNAIAVSMASFLGQCRNAGLLQQEGAREPLFLWHTNLAPGRLPPRRAFVQFHAIGTEHALAEAVVIRALAALVADLFHTEPVVRLNSMGDRETRARYLRELGVFFKRRASLLPPECVAMAASDAFAAAELVIARECGEALPLSTEYLSDLSRKRFEELLEHLESTDTPYELARELMSNGAHWNDACFEILVDGWRVVWGSRYHELARLVLGHPLAALGAVLEIEISDRGEPLAPLPSSKARFVFVHIGDEAKRVSLRLAEDFRRAHVPLAQDIGVESLIEQMRYAEGRNPAYLLVMGRKEALEGTVILRNRQTQEETILPLEGLTDRLKAVA